MPHCDCAIDVHAHFVPENFPTYLPQQAGWPSMAPAHACHHHVMIDGKVYRTVSDRCWDVPLRIADMAEMGLTLQVVSPMPELLSYWLPGPAANDLLRYINDQIAEAVSRAGGRLAAFGAVPLQDMDLALAEMHRLKHDLGFAGIEIGSNINGRAIGALAFEPFFAAAEQLDLPIFVHAVRPAGMDRLVGPANLQQAIAYPGDVGLAAASVITGNLLTRHPHLRIAFSHGGGTLGLLLPRLEQACQVFDKLRETVIGSPTEQARRLFYDALVFDPATLRHLLGLFGDTQVMIGTDYPFAFRDQMPVQRITAAIADDAVRQRLLHGNADRFLGLRETASNGDVKK
jgi:aminocarboxymuconate-semialdehyde decarboxylase